MKKLSVWMFAGLVLAAASVAEAADSWGINHEEIARFDAKVVDLLCELTGDCPPNCGDGKRQFGLLKADGTLIPAVKNSDPFAGAQLDLLPECNKTATIDGLWIKNPKMQLFAVQFVRPEGGKWRRAVGFTKAWNAANHSGEGKPPQWFREDATVKRVLSDGGDLGLKGR